jgi:hypothetical protein
MVLSVLLFTATDYHVVIFKLLVMVLSVLPFTATDYHFVIFFLLVMVLSVLLFTASDDHVGIFWSWYCLSFHLRLLITTLVSSNSS